VCRRHSFNRPCPSLTVSRELFWTVGLKADPRVAQLAYETVIFSARDQLQNVVGSDVSVAYQPIGHAWLQAAKDAGGDAIDLDPADGSFCCKFVILLFTSLTVQSPRLS